MTCRQASIQAATLLGGVIVVASVAMLLINRTGNPAGARQERTAR